MLPLDERRRNGSALRLQNERTKLLRRAIVVRVSVVASDAQYLNVIDPLELHDGALAHEVDAADEVGAAFSLTVHEII